ncbi:MAG: carboxypeptidase regulatory-like domain-containing protein, partial [Planctomycetes bacterium]|nr:carboxypeptidase regulatory-like domain-containing protein [Planctomycetota bacterium]
PGRSAVGRVVDAEGTPVVGAIVECRWDGWRGPPALTSTDVAGLFSTPALPTVGTNPDERGTLSLSITVRHADHPIETRRFELAPSMTSREDDLGEIALAVGRSILGRIVDVDGRPVAGATVIAFPADDPGYSREMQRTTTGDDGWFRFSAVRDREVRLLVEPIALPATEFTATCDVESHCVVARGEPLRIRVRTVGGEPARDVAIRLGTILGDELRGPIARTNAEGIATFAQAPVGPVRHHARRRVLRWTALDAIDDVPTDQAIAELFAPEQLVRCDGVDVPSPAHHGSRNTGAIDLRRREHELVIEDPSERAPVDFRLIDREGRTLHVFTNVLVVSPDDWVMKDFAGLDGRPVHVSCPDVLDGAQLTVMSRGYCWQTEWVDLERTARRVEVALTPTPDRPTRLWIDGGAGREILLAPMVSGREPIAALVIGACDDEGELELSEIGPGRYLVATPLDDTALFQKNGRRRSALRTSAVRFLGTITVAESGGERIPLRWTDTEIPRAEIEDR